MLPFSSQLLSVQAVPLKQIKQIFKFKCVHEMLLKFPDHFVYAEVTFPGTFNSFIRQHCSFLSFSFFCFWMTLAGWRLVSPEPDVAAVPIYQPALLPDAQLASQRTDLAPSSDLPLFPCLFENKLTFISDKYSKQSDQQVFLNQNLTRAWPAVLTIG